VVVQNQDLLCGVIASREGSPSDWYGGFLNIQSNLSKRDLFKRDFGPAWTTLLNAVSMQITINMKNFALSGTVWL
jgi:hypothetical protein